MKKYFAWILIATLTLMSLTGCGQFGASESSEASSENESESKELQNCSEGLTDGGFIEGLEASKYLTLPDFSTFEFASKDYIPAEADVESSITSVMQNFTIQDKEKAIEDGDNVNIDYIGKIDGVAFEGGTAQGADVVAGADNFIDNFLTKIIGHKPGETFDINAKFPDDYGNEEVAGKNAVFTITVNYISVTEELTDDWLKKNKGTFMSTTGIKDVNSRKDVYDHYYNSLYKSKLGNALNDEITAYFKDVELPEKALTIGKNIYDVVIELQTKSTVADLVKNGYVTEEQIEEGRRGIALQILYAQAMAERENLTIGDNDIKEYFSARGLSDYSAYLDYYGKGYLANSVLYDKVTDIVFKEITVDGKPGKEVLPFL